MNELRCYHFGHFQLSSIQQGIQGAHAQMELFVKYNIAESTELDNIPEYAPTTPELQFIEKTNMLYDWGKNHKTMICLNGGNTEGLHMVNDHLDSPDNPFPWANFHESEDAMAGLMTNVAIVLPDYIFNTASWLRNGRNKLRQPEHDNIFLLPPDAIGIDYFDVEYTQWEVDFMYILNKCGLAR